MASTVIRGAQIKDSTVQRHDLDTSTVGQAVVTKLVQGSGVTISSTGADSGTGDVTVTVPNVPGGFIAKTAAYTLTAADSGKYVICSGGSWTLTLPAPASGLTYQLHNDMGISGTTGTITLTPPSGTIDGLSSIALLSQQECTIITDGTNWRTLGLKREVILGTQDITSATASGTVLLPAGYRLFELTWTALGSSVDAQILNAQFSSNGGSTWIAAGYYSTMNYNNTTTGVIALSAPNTTQISLSPYVGTSGNFCQIKAVIYPGAASVQAPTYLADSTGYNATGFMVRASTGGLLSSFTLVNALKYYLSSGNIVNSSLVVKGIV